MSVSFNVSGTYDLRRASSAENFKSGHKYFIQSNRLLQIVMAVQFSVWFVFHGGLTPQPYHRRENNSTRSQCLSEEIVLPSYRGMKMGDGGGGGTRKGRWGGVSIIHHLMPAPVLVKWRIRIQTTEQINNVHGCLKVQRQEMVFLFFSSEVIRHSFAPSTEV